MRRVGLRERQKAMETEEVKFEAQEKLSSPLFSPLRLHSENWILPRSNFTLMMLPRECKKALNENIYGTKNEEKRLFSGQKTRRFKVFVEDATGNNVR